MASKEQQLHLHVREKNVVAIEKLLDSGVNINCMFYGLTPLQLALNQGSDVIAALLIDRGCDIYLHNKNNVAPFEEALTRNLTKIIRKMLKKGLDSNKPLSGNDPPLCYAVSKGAEDTVKELVEVGKCNINTVNTKGESPLFIAAKEGYEKIVNLLLLAGADSDFVCKSVQHTPLIAATSNDNWDVIKYLLKHGCNVNFTDANSRTALWHAYSNSSIDIMRLLLKSGADKEIRSSDGQTILEVAQEEEDDDVIELLSKFQHSWT